MEFLTQTQARRLKCLDQEKTFIQYVDKNGTLNTRSDYALYVQCRKCDAQFRRNGRKILYNGAEYKFCPYCLDYKALSEAKKGQRFYFKSAPDYKYLVTRTNKDYITTEIVINQEKSIERFNRNETIIDAHIIITK